jgi:hypothetical protein
MRNSVHKKESSVVVKCIFKLKQTKWLNGCANGWIHTNVCNSFLNVLETFNIFYKPRFTNPSRKKKIFTGKDAKLWLLSCKYRYKINPLHVDYIFMISIFNSKLCFKTNLTDYFVWNLAAAGCEKTTRLTHVLHFPSQSKLLQAKFSTVWWGRSSGWDRKSVV